jgi:hypothetical protein
MHKPNEKDKTTPRCGVCGKSENLVKTECCGNWICNDTEKYVPFSETRNSCFRNHERFTLCAYHYQEEHEGNWKTCPICRNDFKTEIYVYFGTNEYNFEKLQNPPSFEPTHCAKCKRIINLGEESYTLDGDDFLCEECGPQFS